MKHQKQLERRTFLQDRFDILIKRQRAGTASFNELTELDDIVNRDPAIRESILVEMQEGDNQKDDQLTEEYTTITPVKQQSWLEVMRGFIGRWFMEIRGLSDQINLHVIARN
ncbi:hypothetical protein [Mucilaginibacter dorajii]|uniref:Uncharacterized protein n=1 Tax=Mucilaginibacter dorajii TaxID=692994 RepID=A0ABP7P3S6_9SPHI|nr:hypothetical protein [Mucilaginibacter dorajii]MCS3734376.1 hypothetical protein [Mucilaginibacter dorajii]